LCKIVYANYAFLQGKNGDVVLGDKNPNYLLVVNELLNLFPDSKFIHMVRDPRDNILSFQQVDFDVNGTSALAYRWKKCNEAVLRCSKEHPDQFLLLCYEDLMHDPTEHLNRICAFLEIDYDPGMLEFHKNQRFERLQKGEWHESLRKPLNTGRSYRWKKEMKKSEVLKADYVSGKIVGELGYETTSPGSSLMLFIMTFPGVVYGWLLTFLERFILILPFMKLRMSVINSYRSLTGIAKGE